MEKQERSKISVISEDILEDKNLSLAEKVVYARICYFEEFFESAEATAEYLGIKKSAVQRAKCNLEKMGYIICVNNSGRGKKYVADVNFGAWQIRNICEADSNYMRSRFLKNANIGKNVGKKEGVDSKRNRQTFVKPSVEEVQVYCEQRKNQVDAEAFVDFYESKGWVVGKSPMKDWKAAVRTWERNGYGKASHSTEVYQPKLNEDVSYQKQFENWKKYLGSSVRQTAEQVEACRDLVADVGEEWVEKMIVALRMRSETNFVTREVKAVKDFVSLAENRSLIMGFYNEHWREWQRLQTEAEEGKKPWEL